MERKTVTVRGDTYDLLDDAKPEGITWDRFLQDLWLERRDNEGTDDIVRLSPEQYNGLVDDVSAAVSESFARQIEEIAVNQRF